MNKLLLGTLLAVGICYSAEKCSFMNLGTVDGSSYYHLKCDDIEESDSVRYIITVNRNEITHIESFYYNNGMKQKYEIIGYDYRDIGYVKTIVYDEFKIPIEHNLDYCDKEIMERTIRNKWNKLKRYIKK